MYKDTFSLEQLAFGISSQLCLLQVKSRCPDFGESGNKSRIDHKGLDLSGTLHAAKHNVAHGRLEAGSMLTDSSGGCEIGWRWPFMEYGTLKFPVYACVSRHAENVTNGLAPRKCHVVERFVELPNERESGRAVNR